MFIYLVEYNVPPHISDGGLIAVVAENDYECFDILAEEIWDSQYTDRIMPQIERSIKMEVSDDADPGLITYYIA